MKSRTQKKHPLTIGLVTSVALVAALLSGILLNDRASAANHHKGKRVKVSQNLQAELLKGNNANLVNVVIQFNSKPSGELNSLLNRNGVHVRMKLNELNTVVVGLPAELIPSLSSFSEIDYVSADQDLEAHGLVSQTTGAAYRRNQTSNTGVSYQLDGTGIGIAIFDSGVYAGHKSFQDTNGYSSRVVFSKDFTGENRTDDPYGHGTHVAAIAAANKTYYNAAYAGIAHGSKIVNLRVLNSTGQGKLSSLLQAIDWLLANRTTYNVRVANMSIGMAAIESYKDDPLCNAVRRLVNAGVTVFAAAGNDGKDASGKKVYGRIHSPGNEPSAITVGAANTFGSEGRSDDAVTTFSSRGPTRSFSTDANGVRQYDHLIKPDIVAPGNKIIAAQSPNNRLVSDQPDLNAVYTTDTANKMMFLSGSSMAAPVAAGAAAMLLEMNPKLTPNMIKMILMYTAQPLAGFNMFEQGAGLINIAGAADLTKLVRSDFSSNFALGTPLLTSAPPTPQTTIYDSTFTWSQGILVDRTYAKGINLITKYQRIYGTGVLLSDGVLISDGVLVGDGVLLSDGVIVGDSIIVSNGNTINEGSWFCSTGVLLSDGVLVGDGILIGDGVLVGDGVLLSDGVLVGDRMNATSILTGGDNTASMY